MRTFVVLYVIEGLDQPLYVSSVVLACVAGGYVAAAAAAGRFGDRFGLGAVILVASSSTGSGFSAPGFATSWHWWYYGGHLLGCGGGRDGDDALLGIALQADARVDRGASPASR